MEKDRVLQALDEGRWVRASAGDFPEIAELLDRCADNCHRYNMLAPSAREERGEILRSLLGSCGERCTVHSPFRCDFGFNIHIGEDFIGNFGLSILDETTVRIGRRVMIGPNCSLITILHAPDVEQRADGVMAARPIFIGDDVWLAANVTVLPGVTIGAGSIIGAGSVVTKDIPAGVLAFGNPCRVIRPITEADRVEVFRL